MQIHPKSPLKAHPLCALFPKLAGDELKDLIAGMQQSGFNTDEPIVLLNGDVLDGQNRLFAALEAGVEPLFRDFDPTHDGQSVVQFVINKNIHRRHLSPGTKAALATKIIPMLSDELKGKKLTAPDADVINGETSSPQTGDTAELAAKLFGASKTNVKLAKRLQEKAPDLFQKVLDGTMSANAAKLEFEAREIARRGEQANAAEVLERQHALEAIKETYGEEHSFYMLASKKKILKKLDELKVFSGLPKVEGLKIGPLLSRKGWTIEKAQKFLTADVTDETSLQDFVAYGIANGKKKVTITIDGWKIIATAPDAKKDKQAPSSPQSEAPPEPPQPQPPAEDASNEAPEPPEAPPADEPTGELYQVVPEKSAPVAVEPPKETEIAPLPEDEPPPEEVA